MTRNVFLTWFLIALLAIIDAIWLPGEGMSLAPAALVLIFLPVLGIGGLAWFYTKIRPNPRIAAMAHTASATLAFMSATCILSYLVVTLRRPLADPDLVAADRALGLDWLAMYEWIRARPWIHTVMEFIYMTLIPQIFVLQIILAFRGQIMRVWELFWMFAFTCLGCVILSGLWPAVGAFGYFHVEPHEPYLHEFASLRDGTLKIIDGAGGGMQGLVTFPSLHMALAVLFPYAARGIPVLFPLLLALNLLVIVTTPAIGGHYFADVWGGGILTLAAIWLVRKNFTEKLFIKLQAPVAGRPLKTRQKNTRGKPKVRPRA